MILDILSLSFIRFMKILPILIIAIIASEMLKSYLHKKRIKNAFKENEKNIAKASVIGIATPGPLIAYLPFLKTLKNKGVPVSIIAAFITGQTLIGPARIFFEINYFGIMFLVYKMIIAFLIAIAIGTSFRFLERYVKF